MTEQKQASNLPDLSGAWRDWLGQSERQWNEFFNQMMGTEEFSQGLGRNLDVFLHFQRTMSEAMGTYFTALNIPTRNDVLELGERLLAIENRLAAIEAGLLGLAATRDGATNEAGEPQPRPPRTWRMSFGV